MNHSQNLSLETLSEHIEVVGLVTEEWKDIPGYQEKYQASTFGRIKSYPNRYTGWKTLIITQRLCRNYYYSCLYSNVKKMHCRVNRLIAITFVPNPDANPQVCHSDDDKQNNRSSNLKWGTGFDNMRDAVEKGLLKGKKGEDSPTARLRESQVLEIFNSKLTYDQLSEIYCISRQHIGTIKTGICWGHLTKKKYEQKRKKLSKDVVVNIFNDSSGSHQAIAKKYGVCQVTVSQIKSGKTWKNITENITLLPRKRI